MQSRGDGVRKKLFLCSERLTKVKLRRIYSKTRHIVAQKNMGHGLFYVLFSGLMTINRFNKLQCVRKINGICFELSFPSRLCRLIAC